MRLRRPAIVLVAAAALLLAGCTTITPPADSDTNRTAAPDPTASADVGPSEGALFHELNQTGRTTSTFAAADGPIGIYTVCRGPGDLAVRLSDESSVKIPCDGTPGLSRIGNAKGITSVTVIPSRKSTIWSVSVSQASR